jgi:hypothetical protein
VVSSRCNRSAAKTWARAIDLAPQLLDLQLPIGDQGLVIGGLGSCHREFRLGVHCSGCSITRAAFSATMSFGKASRPESMPHGIKMLAEDS